MRKKLTGVAAVPVMALAVMASVVPPALAEEADPEPMVTPSVIPEASGEDDSLAAVLPKDTGGPQGAVAACDNPYKKWTEITSKKAYFIPAFWPGTSYKDGPGGTMVVRVEKAGKISASITAGAEAELSGVIASAKAKVDVTIGAEVGITVGHEYRRNVANGKYGHLQYGSWGYLVGWKKWETTPDRCRARVIKSGSAKMPTREVGWKYSETAS
jgi:hypothetical protein